MEKTIYLHPFIYMYIYFNPRAEFSDPLYAAVSFSKAAGGVGAAGTLCCEV